MHQARTSSNFGNSVRRATRCNTFMQCIGGVEQCHAEPPVLFISTKVALGRVSQFHILSTLSLCHAKLKRHNCTLPRKAYSASNAILRCTSLIAALEVSLRIPAGVPMAQCKSRRFDPAVLEKFFVTNGAVLFPHMMLHLRSL
jgi:hypothetical protein